MDFRPAVESSAAGVARARHRRAAAVQRGTAGVRAVAEKLLVHGQEYLAVVKYSAPFAAEQLHSLTTSISRALQSLRRFSKELNKPRARWTKEGITP